MEELQPGLFHWTAWRDTIGATVHCHWAREAGAVIDPLLPDAGIDAFADAPPTRVLLTNRHHYRHADRFVAAFGATVHCHEAGLHEFAGTEREVQGFAWGDEVAPGVIAREVGVLTGEETALHITQTGALAFADAVFRRRSGALGFFPDRLLGDDPEAVKAGLRERFAALAGLDWEALLLAHGDPRVEGGRAELLAFANQGGS